ncbi:MAG: BON domain-containing protein [Pseudomonadota bacterium]
MHAWKQAYALILSFFFALALVGCATDRPIGQRVDDQTIETKVKAALIAAKDVSGTAIQVEVRNGEVQLSGFVKTQAEAQRAIDVTRKVDGVRSVNNRMTVRG